MSRDSQTKAQKLDALLVDATPADAASLAGGIERSGLNIFLQSVLTVPEAIDYLNGKDKYSDRSVYPYPDLLLLDLDIPLVTYLDFLRWHRGSSALSLPVLNLGNPRFKDEVVKGTLGGAAAYLAKPLDSDSWTGLARQLWETAKKLAPPDTR